VEANERLSLKDSVEAACEGPARENMLVIGLLGGVASGKSLVAEELARLGAGVLDADRAGHEVLRSPSVEEAARQRWGETVFGPDGRIDRRRLATIVFASGPEAAAERKSLEQMTHPAIGRLLWEQARAMEACGKPGAVLDAPLLLEAGWDKLCNTLVFVDAPRQLRLSRAMARGWTESDFEARERAQHSVDEKRKRAAFVVDNSGPPEQTRVQVEQIWHSLFG